MKHGASNRRSRNRGGNNRRGNQNKMQVFDSNGPDVRIRGTAHQVFEKYTALAKDAYGAGDLILAESYLQHAEHYQRLINSWEENMAPRAASAPATQAEQPEAVDGNTKDADDLALPASIVGAAVETTAPVLEDA